MRIFGEVNSKLSFIVNLILLDKLFELRSSYFIVVLVTLLLLDFIEHSIHVITRKSHSDVGEHQDKTTIAVISETLIVALFSQSSGSLVIQAEVEDGIHHTRHGDTSSGTDGEKQRLLL